LSLSVILAIGAFGFLISYLFFKTEGEGYGHHFLLRLLLLGILFGVFVLLGSSAMDASRDCQWLVTEINTTGDPHDYSNQYVCLDEPKGYAVTFYKLTLWTIRLLAVYLLIYFLYEVFMYFSRVVSGKRGRSKKE
jgi:hypothetical protein